MLKPEKQVATLGLAVVEASLANVDRVGVGWRLLWLRWTGPCGGLSGLSRQRLLFPSGSLTISRMAVLRFHRVGRRPYRHTGNASGSSVPHSLMRLATVPQRCLGQGNI
jgi:hypothetical protein